eukprot:365117-Chlamydomonas_euryale.AAC.11
MEQFGQFGQFGGHQVKPGTRRGEQRRQRWATTLAHTACAPALLPNKRRALLSSRIPHSAQQGRGHAQQLRQYLLLPGCASAVPKPDAGCRRPSLKARPSVRASLPPPARP